MGLEGPYIHYGRMPSTDTFGYEVAIETVLASSRPGKYSQEYTQWDSVRKSQTAYANHVRVSPQANCSSLTLGDDKGRAQRFVEDGCSSYWYSRFSTGCKHRMGQDWRPNTALSTALLLAYLKDIEGRIYESETMSELNRWLVLGAYSAVTYLVSLRGSEGFLIDLGGLRSYQLDENRSQIISSYH
jgi:hypothetical protein